MAFRCTNCNGDIRFDIESQLMKCDHCGSTFDPDSFRVRNVSDEEVFRDQGLTLFLCSGCGAELQGTEESEVGFCPYCGGQSFLKKGSGGGEVENILPFQITKDRCAELFRQYARGVRYLPKDMKRPEHLENFTGIYMPYYEYDVEMGKPSIQGSKTVEHHKSYDVVNTYQIDAQIQGDYCGVPYDASRYLDDEIADRVLPFDMSKQREFTPAYLSGFYADASTVPPATYYADAREQASQDMVDEIANQVYRKERIKVEKETASIPAQTRGHHASLLPMWFLTWRKGERVAYAVVNGESGKVTADLPVDMKAFALGCLVIAGAIFAFLELLFQPTPGLTSVISLVCGALMAVSVRSSTKQLYEKQTHANDKGWKAGTNQEDAEQAEAARKRKARRKVTVPTTVFALLAIMLLSAGPNLLNMVGGTLGVLVGAAALLLTLIMAASVFKLKREIPQKQPVFAILLILAGVILNTVIVYLAPVNDGWYYLGDAVGILLLVIAAVSMMRVYNTGTTRPLPKLFDRNEV